MGVYRRQYGRLANNDNNTIKSIQQRLAHQIEPMNGTRMRIKNLKQ